MLGVDCTVLLASVGDVKSAFGQHQECQRITPGKSFAKLINARMAKQTTITRQPPQATNFMKKKPCDHEYEFALILSGVSDLTDEIENALYEAGCDDATVAMRSGRMVITFARFAPSMKDAILTAIRDIRRANIGAEVVRVDHCHLVTQADIARRIGRSRQLVHQYRTGARGPGSFPPPVCEIADGSPLWAWCDVAHWLCENGILKKDELRHAEDIDAINAWLELQSLERRNPKLMAEIRRKVPT